MDVVQHGGIGVGVVKIDILKPQDIFRGAFSCDSFSAVRFLQDVFSRGVLFHPAVVSFTPALVSLTPGSLSFTCSTSSVASIS